MALYCKRLGENIFCWVQFHFYSPVAGVVVLVEKQVNARREMSSRSTAVAINCI
jgi:hypothetical protein